jgi:type I restriction enzyme S subunit
MVEGVADWLGLQSVGATMQNLNTSIIGRIPLVVPPTEEQGGIAAFLDRETARIDALVAKKERLIELLQEQRTALITRAVTKGLDPNVPMKDSGIEWLGEIPGALDGEAALAPDAL